MEEVVENNGIPTTYGEKVDPPRGFGGHLDSIIEFEKNKIKENVEWILATDLKGTPFGDGVTTNGIKSNVDLTSNTDTIIRKYVETNGNYTVIITHNHPSSSSFSPGDIIQFILRNYLIEVRACGNFYRYVMQKPKNKLNSLKIFDENFNKYICNIDPNVKIFIQKTKGTQNKYWMKKWREEGDASGIKLNEKFKNDPKYSIFIEASDMSTKEICKQFGILYSRYEADFPENIENQEIKEKKVELTKNDVVSLTEKKDITSIEKKQAVIDDRYDILPVLDIRDISYESTMLRKPYPFEDFESFNKKKNQEKKQEYEKIGIDEKSKTILETRNLTVRRKAKLKGASDIVGGIPTRRDYSYIPMGRTFGMGGYGLTVFGSTVGGTTNEPYTGERRKSNNLKVTSPSTQSYNGWPVLFTKEQQREFLVTDKLPGLKSPITCTKQVLPIFYNLIYDLHKSVEPLKSTSCFKVRKASLSKSSWSCHASGTAIDFNHHWHPLHHSNTFKPNQVAQIQKLIKRYGIRWGGDFKDDMHFEINITENDAKLLIQKLNLVDRMNKIKSGINVPVQ